MNDLKKLISKYNFALKGVFMPEYLNIQNIFLVISLFSTIFYIIKLCLFMFLGGDVEVQADFDSLSDVDPSFSFFSIQSMLAFFMGFGWVGLFGLTQLKAGILVSLIAAFVMGIIFMFISAWLMYMVKKLDKRIVVDLNETVGTTAKAYTAFKPHGEGQIEITVNNKLDILKAFNMTDEKIDAFAQVKVEKVEDNKLYIIKI